jgi:DNA-binding GntR family transcriptional regulator
MTVEPTLRDGDTPRVGRALVDEIAAAIQRRIMEGDLKIGEKLKQEALAAEYSISRTPVREALRLLQANGIVELHPHRGAVVRGPRVREIREAYVVRAELEGLAAELAAEWITPEELDKLRAAEALFEESMPELREARTRADAPRADSAWVRANDLFHTVVHDAAHNDFLRVRIQELHTFLPRNLTWSTLIEDPRLAEDNLKQHRLVRGALEEHDAAAARQAMTLHVRRAGELVAAWFERRLEQEGT